MLVGEKIRALRKAKGMTMAELGEVLGITAAAVSRYELGQREPNFETLKKISQTLDISLNELLEIQPLPDAKIVYNDGKEGKLDSEDQEFLAFDQYLDDLGYHTYIDLTLQTKDEKPWIVYDKREDVFYCIKETQFLNTLQNNINAFAKFQICELLRNSEKIKDPEIRTRYNQKYKKEE